MRMTRSKNPVLSRTIPEILAMEGIVRKPLAYTADGNLNSFDLKKGAEIPIHQHDSSQIGYILKGKIRFFTESSEFFCSQGDSYAFEGNEKHGAEILEDSTVLDFFCPLREDYLLKE